MRTQIVKVRKARTWGSKTGIDDELSIPFWLYHGGRGLGWLWQRPIKTTIVTTTLWLWSLGVPVVLGPVLATLLVWGFVAYRLAAQLRALTGAAQPERKWDQGWPSPKELGTAWKRKRQLRKRWELACERGNLLSPRKGMPPALRKLRPTEGGYEVKLTCAPLGILLGDVRSASSTLQEIIQCADVKVTELSVGVAKVAFYWGTTLDRVIGLESLPLAPAGQLAYGVRRDGTPATIQLALSVLIGGGTGSGKSSLVHTLIADAIRQGVHMEIYISDPKGGMELDAYEQWVGVDTGPVRIAGYAKTTDETTAMVYSLAGMDTSGRALKTPMPHSIPVRQAALKAQKIRRHTPSAEFPHRVLILDETLPLKVLLDGGHASPLGIIAYTARAAGYSIWANAQVGQVSELGRFRDFIPQRLCFKTTTDDVTNAVLGKGSEARGAKCSDIRVPGVGFSFDEQGEVLSKFRAPLVEDKDVALIASGRIPVTMPMPAKGKAERQAGVYFHYGTDNELIYIGESTDVDRRTGEHMRDKPWWPEIERTEVTWCDSKAVAVQTQDEAIRRLGPRENVMHNGARRRGRMGDVKGQIKHQLRELVRR